MKNLPKSAAWLVALWLTSLLSFGQAQPGKRERPSVKVDWIRAKARFDPVFFGLRIKDAGKKGVFAMMIIGCDFHPSWQQIAWLDSETGETGEQKLVHASGDAKIFYQQLAASVLIGMEATGNSQWFVEPVEDLGHEIWIGDAAQIRASYVRKQKTDKRDAAQILKPVVEGRFPRLWMPDREQRDLRQLVLHRHKLAMIRSRVKNELQHLSLNKGMQKKRTLWSQAGRLETLGFVPAGRLAGIACDAEPAGQQAGRRRATRGRRKSAGEVADDPAGSGSEHGAGVRADHR
jgi:hypothetical protein